MITIGNWQAVAIESQKETPISHRLDAEYFRDQLQILASALEKGGALNGGCYSYTPRKRQQHEAQSWTCSDGGILYGSLSDLMARIVTSDKLDALDADENWMLEQLVIPTDLGQGEYETGHIRGDW